MFKSSFTSTNTGLAPKCIIEFAVAINEIGEVIISSFFFIPKLHRDIIKASVPEFRPKQNFEPVNFVINFSNLELESDKTNFPDLRTLSTELKISFFSS